MNRAPALLAEFKRLLEERDRYIVQLETDKAKLISEVAALKTTLNELDARRMEAAAMKHSRSH